MSIKNKVVSGLSWSFLDSILNQLATLLIGIVIARFLTPEEFGLIGMVTVFIGISEIFVQSGFTAALIRKQDCTDNDYSTVFFFNLVVALLFYGLFYLLADAIALFYGQPQLVAITKVLSLAMVFRALAIVQNTKLLKGLKFKEIMLVSLSSVLVSGLVGIVLTLQGYGVWALVYMAIAKSVVFMIMMWSRTRWWPKLVFDTASFKSMFAFGSKLSLLGLIDVLYRNVYITIIGKYYSAAHLGQFNRAESFQNLSIKTFNGVIKKVSYPVFSKVQKDAVQLRSSYRGLTQSTMLISIAIMTLLGGVAPNFVVLLIGENWKDAGQYLQLLCISGMFFPAISLNSEILKVKGKSGVILNLGIVRKVFAIPVILAIVFGNVTIMLYAMVFHKVVNFLLMAHYGGGKIDYGIRNQVIDILPMLCMAVGSFSAMLVLNVHLELPLLLKLVVQLITGLLLLWIPMELFKLKGYVLIKSAVFSRFKR